MANLDLELQGLSSEEEPNIGEKDTEYIPESKSIKISQIEFVDSQTKLKILMDQIDGLNHSLNQCQPRKNDSGTTGKRRHGPENDDEKDLVSSDISNYTIRLTEQPKNIVGGVMRDYQLEGLN